MTAWRTALLLWAGGPGLAADPTPPSDPSPCDLATSVTALSTRGSKEDYLCVATAPEAPAALIAALDRLDAGNPDTDGPQNRYTRALALWLLAHDERPWDPALVRRLSADDRRLLSDGVHARRGRASPAPDHDAIFRNLPWYNPDAGYTNGRLTPEDRARIALADKPPPVEPPAPLEEIPGLDGSSAGATDPAAADGCGCSARSGPPGPVAPLAPLAVLALARHATRRRG